MAVLDQLAGPPGGMGQAGALGEVLLLGGAAVVGGPAVGEDGGDPGPAGVPGPGPGGQGGAVPVPDQTVLAGRIRGGHAVLLARLVERVAADPGVPAAVPDTDHRVLDGGAVVATEDRPGLGVGQAGRVVGLEHVDPPVLTLRGGRADVQAPAARPGAQQRRPFHRHGPEPGLVEDRHRGQPLAVGRPGDHRGRTTLVGHADPVGDDEAAVPVEGGAGRAHPVPGSRPRCRDGHRGPAHARKREAGHGGQARPPAGPWLMGSPAAPA